MLAQAVRSQGAMTIGRHRPPTSRPPTADSAIPDPATAVVSTMPPPMDHRRLVGRHSKRAPQAVRSGPHRCRLRRASSDADATDLGSIPLRSRGRRRQRPAHQTAFHTTRTAGALPYLPPWPACRYATPPLLSWYAVANNTQPCPTLPTVHSTHAGASLTRQPAHHGRRPAGSGRPPRARTHKAPQRQRGRLTTWDEHLNHVHGVA